MSHRGRSSNWRGGRSRGRGRGFKRRHHDSKNEENSKWVNSVKENNQRDAIDLEFNDYNGEKMHELPEDFVEIVEKNKEEVFSIEKDFGITEYLNPSVPGFNGILKHRYSDFIVHEIDKEGNLIKLTDASVPASGPNVDSQADKPNVPEYADLTPEDQALFSQLSWTRICQLVAKMKGENDPNQSVNANVKIDVTNKSKEERFTLHKTVQRLCPMLDTNTCNQTEGAAEKKYIQILPKKVTTDPNKWPRERPKNLVFYMCKEGCDATAIFGQMAKYLRVHNSHFKVAGTKDKRAVTTQKVSISWVTAEKLKKAIQSIRFNTVSVGNFSYSKSGLELGDLQGNHFTILLRNISETNNNVIGLAVETLRDNGFINYFGQQRFGTQSSVKTSDIGLAMIKGQWLKAIELILRPRAGESLQMTQMRAHWWMYRKPRDAVVLLGSRISQSRNIEATLLNGLAEENDNDYVNAIGHLAKNTRLLYLHAYQSYIWNCAVSQRIQKFGFDVLVGDLVSLEVNSSEDKHAVKTLTAEEVGDYSINDVLMPLPGYKAIFPANEELKKIYIDLLEADGLMNGFDSFKHKVDFFSLAGAYRSVIVKPTDVSWRSINHSDMNENLLVSDQEILSGKSHKKSEENGEFRALIIELTLPSSTYATMALREAMKVDMCKGSQSKLTENLIQNLTTAKKAKVDEGDQERLD